jgi:hypothetical protein
MFFCINEYQINDILKFVKYSLTIHLWSFAVEPKRILIDELAK